MDPGVNGIGTLLPIVLGVLGNGAVGATVGNAEPAADDCPDAYPESYISGLPFGMVGRSLAGVVGDCIDGRASSEVGELGEKSSEWSGRWSWKVVLDALGNVEKVSL